MDTVGQAAIDIYKAGVNAIHQQEIANAYLKIG
jgi:hypothetical protein